MYFGSVARLVQGHTVRTLQLEGCRCRAGRPPQGRAPGPAWDVWGAAGGHVWGYARGQAWGQAWGLAGGQRRGEAGTEAERSARGGAPAPVLDGRRVPLKMLQLQRLVGSHLLHRLRTIETVHVVGRTWHAKRPSLHLFPLTQGKSKKMDTLKVRKSESQQETLWICTSFPLVTL